MINKALNYDLSSIALADRAPELMNDIFLDFCGFQKHLKNQE